MRLSKYDLISQSSYWMDGVGHIKAVRLRDIDSLPQKYEMYQLYTNLLYCDAGGLREISEADTSECVSAFDVFVADERLKRYLLLILDFFIDEDVVLDQKNNVYITTSGDTAVGRIDGENFRAVASVILQRCGIDDTKRQEEQEFKNKRAKELWEKMHGKSDKKGGSPDMELGNIISHLAAVKDGLTMLNIWDLTIYNVYDQFSIVREIINYKRNSISLAVWGDKENKFDPDCWFKIGGKVNGL